MLYELRIYHAYPGRLAALHKRFETITLKFWEKYGIRQVGFWTVTIGESSNDLYYMLAWESLAEREQKWGAFAADADWIKARIGSETEAGGPLTSNIDNFILSPTSYSAIK
jgi:NIPSNAP protein